MKLTKRQFEKLKRMSNEADKAFLEGKFANQIEKIETNCGTLYLFHHEAFNNLNKLKL